MQNNQLTPQNKDLLSIGEASEYLGISIDTLRRWEKKGRIEPFRSPGGHRYFDKKTLDDLFGKRYTRDEATIRRPKIDNKEEDPVVTPPPSLPPWKQINYESFEVEKKTEPETP